MRTVQTRWIWLLVAALTVWMCAATPLLSEECYYWLYAKHLDWSYFDHPPMVAWMIRAGTSLLGEHALGVRLCSALGGLATTWIGLRWLRELSVDIRAQPLWILLSLGVPAIASTHLFATPDAPLTLFYAWAAFALWRCSLQASVGRWVVAGVLVGLAMLSKYTAAFLGVGLLLQLLLDRPFRTRARVPHLALLGLCALLVFSPVLYWNWRNGWISLLFQSNERYSAWRISPASPLQFLAAQMALTSPLLVWAVWKAGAWAWLQAREGDKRFLGLLCYGLPLPLFLTCNALLVAPKVHWAIPAFVPLGLLVTAWWQARGQAESSAFVRRLGGAWIALAFLLALLAPALRYLPQSGGSRWDADGVITAKALEAARPLAAAAGERVFLFTDNHRDSAELAWGQRSAYASGATPLTVLAANAVGRRAKQFDFWTAPTEVLGWNAVYVVTNPEDNPEKIARARLHFASFESVGRATLQFAGHTLREAEVFVGRGYRGPQEAIPQAAPAGR